MGINNYYFKNIEGRLTDSKYWDFNLSSDNQGDCLDYLNICSQDRSNADIVRDSLLVWFDVNQSGTTVDGSVLSSLVSWSDVDIQPNSGFTLNDVGLTMMDNGRVSGLTGISWTFITADTKVKLYPVSGYSGNFRYDWTYRTGVTTSNGCLVGNTICLDGGFYQGFFKLDFDEPAPINRYTISTNCGTEITATTKVIVSADTKYDLMPTTYDRGWSMETWIKNSNTNCIITGNTAQTLNNFYSGNSGFFFYIGTRAEDKFRNVFSGESGIYTTTGIPLQPNIDINIDSGGQDWINRSSYNFVSTCCSCNVTTSSGTTATTYCDMISENALGFRITPDGRIGYRKMTFTGTCLNNGFQVTGSTMLEGYSDVVYGLTGDSWMHLTITYTPGGVYNTFPSGVLKFWVNGRMIYKVNNFVGLLLRGLNTWSDKQIGVPYNISWGGGTQGLLETQTFGGPDIEDENLALQQYFTGTLDGELSQLRFYEKPLNIMEIRNNMFFDCTRYCMFNSFGGATIIQEGSPLCGDCGKGDLTAYL